MGVPTKKMIMLGCEMAPIYNQEFAFHVSNRYGNPLSHGLKSEIFGVTPLAEDAKIFGGRCEDFRWNHFFGTNDTP